MVIKPNGRVGIKTDSKGAVISSETVLEVDPSAFTYMLINSVKELKEDNDRIKSENEKIKGENELLKKDIALIKKRLGL